MIVELFTSAFCAPCRAARAVLTEAAHLVPQVRVAEVDVVAAPQAAQEEGVLSTPTVVVRTDSGSEVFRAAGAPTLPQLLAAMARAT